MKIRGFFKSFKFGVFHRGSLEVSLGCPEASWRRLGASEKRLGGFLEGLRSILEVSWRRLRAPWGHLGRVLGKMSKKGRVHSTFWRGFESQNEGKNHQNLH